MHGPGVELPFDRPQRRRREPEKSVLYRVLAEHLETFLSRTSADETRGSLPRFVERELRAFLDCGLLQRGFARVFCPQCRTDELVAFSCKCRGFCPACGARRMADTAAHLVDRVLPDVPTRQWVLSLPFEIRFLLARDPDLCARIRAIFVRAVFSFLRRRARERGVTQPRPGSVMFQQRFDSALRLNVHFHGLFPDGVFTCEPFDRAARFHPLEPPTDDDVARLTKAIHDRVVRLLRRRGQLASDDERIADVTDGEPSPLDACRAAAVQGKVAFGRKAGTPVRRLGRRPDLRPEFRPGVLCAFLEGFSLHAGVVIEPGERERLERLARYVARPAIVEERLSLTRDGKVLYRLKRPFKDGSTAVVFEPLTFLERLAALIPRPRKNLVTYHGVFAPAASYRDRIVPEPPENDEEPPRFRSCRHRARTHATEPEHRVPARLRRPRRYTWAELLRRVFRIEVLKCPSCGGRRRLLTFLTHPDTIRRILAHLGLPTELPPVAAARPPPRADLPFTTA